jgi:hypothetical protein
LSIPPGTPCITSTSQKIAGNSQTKIAKERRRRRRRRRRMEAQELRF